MKTAEQKAFVRDSKGSQGHLSMSCFLAVISNR